MDVESDTPRPDLVLHWAIDDWVAPPEAVWPPATRKVDDKAVQTPLQDGTHLTVSFPEVRLSHRASKAGGGMWLGWIAGRPTESRHAG